MYRWIYIYIHTHVILRQDLVSQPQIRPGPLTRNCTDPPLSQGLDSFVLLRWFGPSAGGYFIEDNSHWEIRSESGHLKNCQRTQTCQASAIVGRGLGGWCGMGWVSFRDLVSVRPLSLCRKQLCPQQVLPFAWHTSHFFVREFAVQMCACQLEFKRSQIFCRTRSTCPCW
jgi:hypothetical protein